jgi:hypothetical protein
VLDPDGDVVEPDGVAAHDVEGYELVDPAVPVDDEVGTRAGKLAEFGVGRVRRERVPRCGEAVGRR